MPSITALPYEIILEITRSAALRDSVALLVTCKVLHEIYKARPFWIDQVLRLKQRFDPLLPDHVGSLAIENLKRTAWNPYLFETAIRQQKIRLSSYGRLNTPIESKYWDAKVVPGGQWLFTLSSEVEAGGADQAIRSHSLLRVWCITQAVPTCVASLELRNHLNPLELCLQPGDSSLDLFVFVNSYRYREGLSYLQVSRINMADDIPQFSPVAELNTDQFCRGMGIQGRNVIVTLTHQGRDWSEALIWDWKTDEKNVVRSPEPGGRYWFMAASKAIVTLWDLETESIEVHLPSPLGGYAKVGNHRPVLESTRDSIDQALVPTLIDPWNSGTDLRQIALAHFDLETVRIDMENLGAGRIGFTSYLKDNRYMQDVSGPHGNEHETPSYFFKTVSDHLVDLSSSGRLTYYLSPKSGSQGTESISYYVHWQDENEPGDIHFPFICPFSGIVGSVSVVGDLFVWRLEQAVCSSGGENSNVGPVDMVG